MSDANEFRALVEEIEHGKAGTTGALLQPRDRAWMHACREIIDRCVAPNMRGNALAMLERAAAEAARNLP